MNDTWINWGDFVGKNKEQLDNHDMKVALSQAEQAVAMQKGLDRLGSAYGGAAKATEDDYAKKTEELYADMANPYRSTSTVAPTQGNRVGSRGGQVIGRVAAGSRPKADASGQFNPNQISQSYSALMAAQNSAQANAFKGYQTASAPGWQNALYSTRAQYSDPWKDLQSKIDPIANSYVQRTAAAGAAYDQKVAEREAMRGKATKPSGADVNGNPVYADQEDPGPRNVAGYAQDRKKPLEGVVGYA